MGVGATQGWESSLRGTAEPCGGEDKGRAPTPWCCLGPLPFQPLFRGLTIQAARSADASMLRSSSCHQHKEVTFPRARPGWALVPFSLRFSPGPEGGLPKQCRKHSGGRGRCRRPRTPSPLHQRWLPPGTCLLTASSALQSTTSRLPRRRTARPSSPPTSCGPRRPIAMATLDSLRKCAGTRGVPGKAGSPRLTTKTPPASPSKALRTFAPMQDLKLEFANSALESK